MAEVAVVSALIDIFAAIVAEKGSQEVSWIVNAKKDFEFFSKQLLSIKCLLEDVGKKEKCSLVVNWLQSLEDFVADAEYLLEECGAADNIFTKLKLRPKMGPKIRELKERLEQIQRIYAENIKLLAAVSVLDVVHDHGQVRHADSFKERRERSYARLQESHIVGMDGDIKAITQWILKKDNPPVIAVVGMGGQGKTLLLQHVFKNEEISQCFDHKVWLAVSQKFDVVELLRQVLRDFEPNFDSKKLNKGQLIDKIHKKLEGKRCLFAVDDVWDPDFWKKIGLPSRTQDKVVVTTRDENVAKHMGARRQILPKNSLSEEDSWRLFCIHAFPDDPNGCPNEVEYWARQIVNKCSRLPLAIKTIGAHMAIMASDLPNKWEHTFIHLNETHGMSTHVMPSLKFSYEALPHYLKPCFLYCSLYPKNTEIESHDLVHAWIAQGFVSAKLPEAYDVGCSYMEKLIDRCLIEVSQVGWNERVNSCKMHDLLHDLAVEEQNENPRRRSLLLSDNTPLRSISPSFFDNMRYLCVLDLRRTSITSLPESIKILKLLKYLNLSGTYIQELPKSLSGLRQLQFLDISDTDVEELHEGIEKQKHMLHLNLVRRIKYFPVGRFKYGPVGISKLIYLQTLNGITFDLGESRSASASALQLRDLKELRDLQHLSIVFRLDRYGDVRVEDEETFRDMTKMRTLQVDCSSSNGRGGHVHLPTDMEAMQRLEIVHLFQCVVPKWIFQLQNLMELSLIGPGNSSSADFRGLEKIPNLKKLHWEWNINPDFIEFPNEFGEAGAFPKLEELVIQRFGYLKSIPSFHEDAMPKLKCLRITGYEPLENMPEGLMKLRNLEEVEVEMKVDDVQGFEYTKSHCWQSFKDRGIKIKVEVYQNQFRGDIRLRVV